MEPASIIPCTTSRPQPVSRRIQFRLSPFEEPPMLDHRHKHALPDHPILPVLSERWSPYVYDPQRSVEREKLLACLEAARWAASSFNEQPWSFFVATREQPEEFARMLGCLVEQNQAWA